MSGNFLRYCNFKPQKKTLFLFLDTERSSSKRWTYWFKVSAVKVFSETFIKRIVSIDLVHSLYV